MTPHRCGPPSDAAVDRQVAEVVMAAPMSLALTWHDERGLRLLFDRACRLEDELLEQGLCLTCGKPLPVPVLALA